MFVAVAVLSMMLLAAPARADTVTQWNQIATSALVADGQGSSAVVQLAMVHAAVYDPVNAIDRRYEPYLVAPKAKRWYSRDAAAATAAYRVLVDSKPPVFTPANQTTLVASVTAQLRSSMRACGRGSTSAHADEQGALIGKRVAHCQETRFPRPAHDDHHHNHDDD